jgi:hypothetical protein
MLAACTMPRITKSWKWITLILGGVQGPVPQDMFSSRQQEAQDLIDDILTVTGQ